MFEETLKAEFINLTNNRYELVRNYPMPGIQVRFSVLITI